MTIAELIAAKKAAQAAPAKPAPVTAAASSAPKESLAEKLAAKEAIDRIDAPGKQERATAARKSAGLVLNKDMPCAPESRGQATPIAGPEEPRALGARIGEALTVLPADPAPEAVAWDAVLNRWETDLVIMADPEPGSESAWIALKPGRGGGLPVLLHKLPFWPHPARKRTEGEPF